MICDIYNIECKYAGECTYFGCKELGEEEGMHTATICYYQDGIVGCPYKNLVKK